MAATRRSIQSPLRRLPGGGPEFYEADAWRPVIESPFLLPMRQPVVVEGNILCERSRRRTSTTCSWLFVDSSDSGLNRGVDGIDRPREPLGGSELTATRGRRLDWA
jgi:hypothetical protein